MSGYTISTIIEMPEHIWAWVQAQATDSADQEAIAILEEAMLQAEREHVAIPISLLAQLVQVARAYQGLDFSGDMKRLADYALLWSEEFTREPDCPEAIPDTWQGRLDSFHSDGGVFPDEG